jgi:hypothetical protein
MNIASPDKTHVIRWKSTMTGGTGIGTKLFDQEEAERVAAELNTDYPDIQHEAIIPPPPVVPPPPVAEFADAKPDPAVLSER